MNETVTQAQEADTVIIIKSSPYQYKDICHLDNGEACEVVHRIANGYTNVSSKRQYYVLKFLGSKRDNKYAWFGVFQRVGATMHAEGTDIYTEPLRTVKLFQLQAYRYHPIFRRRKHHAIEFANDCQQYGEETACQMWEKER